jgi:hypothetical protein
MFDQILTSWMGFFSDDEKTAMSCGFNQAILGVTGASLEG